MNELIIDVTDDSYQRDVLDAELPVLLEFWAPWCGPCKAVAPMLDRLAQAHAGALRVAKYDVDQSDQSRARYGIRGVPTLIAYRHGQEVMRSTGVSAGSLQAILNAALFGPAAAGTAEPSFKGNAQLKAQALQILQEVRTAPGEAAPAALPTVLLAERLGGGDYTAVLGLPAFVGILHDGLSELGSGQGADLDIAVRWLQALPIGKSLDALLPALAQAVLHDAALGLLPGLLAQTEHPALQAFVSELMALQADIDAQPAAWAETSRSLARLEAELGSATLDGQRLLLLKDLAKPLARIGALDLMSVIPMAVSLGSAAAQQPYTPEDEQALAGLRAQLAPLHGEPAPSGLDDAALSAWQQTRQQRSEAVVSAFWQANPALAQRIRERDAAISDAHQQRLRAMLDLLLGTVHAAA